MSRVACKIAARSVRLVMVLLLFIVWWEPLCMQVNTRSVCMPLELAEKQTEVAQTGGAGSQAHRDGGQTNGERVTSEAAESLAAKTGTPAGPFGGEARLLQEKLDVSAGASGGGARSSVSADAAQADQGLMSENQASGPPPEAVGAAKASKVYTVVATGYYAGVESTGKHPGHPQYGITYSGVRARRGIISTIAADLSIFPIGTLLYIPGYGYGVVADIGSAVKGNVIDLYFQTKEDIYREWGKRTVEVIVIEEGDGHLDEERLAELEEMFRNKPSPPSAL